MRMIPANLFKSITMLEERRYIHVHYLDNNQECAEQGYMDIEVCCHICDESIIMRVSADLVIAAVMNGTPNDTVAKIKSQFVMRHSECEINCEHEFDDSSCSAERKFVRFIEVK